CTLNIVGVCQLVGASDLGVDAKRVKHRLEFGFVHTLVGNPVNNSVLGIDAFALLMNSLEDGRMQNEAAMGFEGVIQSLQVGHACIEGNWHAFEYGVFRQGFGPFLDQWLHCCAVGAAVGEEFKNLGFSGGVGRLGG